MAFCPVVPAHSLDQAVGRLRAEKDVALILCGVHFDDSRMFDLPRTARSDFAAIPFVCCRIQAIDIAAKSLGAAAFVDMPGLSREFGNDGAEAQFRSSVLAHPPPGGARSETGL